MWLPHLKVIHPIVVEKFHLPITTHQRKSQRDPKVYGIPSLGTMNVMAIHQVQWLLSYFMEIYIVMSWPHPLFSLKRQATNFSQLSYNSTQRKYFLVRRLILVRVSLNFSTATGRNWGIRLSFWTMGSIEKHPKSFTCWTCLQSRLELFAL